MSRKGWNSQLSWRRNLWSLTADLSGRCPGRPATCYRVLPGQRTTRARVEGEGGGMVDRASIVRATTNFI